MSVSPSLEQSKPALPLPFKFLNLATPILAEAENYILFLYRNNFHEGLRVPSLLDQKNTNTDSRNSD